MMVCVDDAPGVAEGQTGFGKHCCSSLVGTANDHSSEFVVGWEILASRWRSHSLELLEPLAPWV
jgi:hypothetical protein